MPNPESPPTYRRKKKLIKPRLQLKLMSVFACVAACSVLLQSITLACTMSSLADQLPHDGNILMSKVVGFLWMNLLITLAFVLPLHLIVGRTVTFKIAGPIYRFETYFKQLIRGERPGPCKIRKDDELQELCGLLNEAIQTVAPSREEEEAVVEDPPAALPSGGSANESVSSEPEAEAQAHEGGAASEK